VTIRYAEGPVYATEGLKYEKKRLKNRMWRLGTLCRV
jgi:hypothetical protein